MLAALAALVLAAAPAAPALASADECDALWDQTVSAAAPDLTPTDDLRRGFLLKEKAQLSSRCVASDRDVLTCAKQGSDICHARADGGSVTGLARCVYPAVQECVQRARLVRARKDESIAKMFDFLAATGVKPETKTATLPPELSNLSLGGVVLNGGNAFRRDVVLLVFNERNTRLRGVLFSTDALRFPPGKKPPATVLVGGVTFNVIRVVDSRSAELSTDAP